MLRLKYLIRDIIDNALYIYIYMCKCMGVGDNLFFNKSKNI